MSIVKINEVELEVNVLSPNFMERYENAFDSMNERFDETKKNAQNIRESEGLRQSCEIINEFFDNIFGDGTAKRIFPGEMDLGASFDAMEAVVDETIRQRHDLNNRSNRYMQRHFGNREQRRNAKKHGKNNRQGATVIQSSDAS